MADDVDDLVSRLDRIEALLRRRSAVVTPPVPAGTEVRSARSIVSRIDDVWVAVTEGNERVVAAIAATGGTSAPGAADRPHLEPPGAADRPHLEPPGVAEITSALHALATRFDAIEQHLAALAAREGPGSGADQLLATEQATDDRPERIEEALAASDASGNGGALHLRLDRIEEALAGIAGRLGEPLTASTAGAGADRLHVDVQRLSERVAALARAIEASAARCADGTLTDRLGRLRDQFRR